MVFAIGNSSNSGNNGNSGLGFRELALRTEGYSLNDLTTFVQRVVSRQSVVPVVMKRRLQCAPREPTVVPAWLAGCLLACRTRGYLNSQRVAGEVVRGRLRSTTLELWPAPPRRRLWMCKCVRV